MIKNPKIRTSLILRIIEEVHHDGMQVLVIWQFSVTYNLRGRYCTFWAMKCYFPKYCGIGSLLIPNFVQVFIVKIKYTRHIYLNLVLTKEGNFIWEIGNTYLMTVPTILLSFPTFQDLASFQPNNFLVSNVGRGLQDRRFSPLAAQHYLAFKLFH